VRGDARRARHPDARADGRAARPVHARARGHAQPRPPGAGARRQGGDRAAVRRGRRRRAVELVAQPGAKMTTLVQAVRLALHGGEERLGVADVFGGATGPPLGGVFTQTQGLKTAWNSPLDERGIVGTAMGLAMAGQRPVAEIQFCDYAFNTIDLLKLAGGVFWSSNGTYNCPMVLMTPVGSGIHGSMYHSHSFDGQAARTPGGVV